MKFLNNINTLLLDYFKHAWMSGKRCKRTLKEISSFNRDFNVADATFMCISSCLSFTLYTNLVSQTQIYGPLLSLAFVIGAILTSLTVACMAELVAKYPVMGSTYLYCYRFIGEFIGFMVGWAGMFAYFIECVRVINGCSLTLDYLFFDNTLDGIYKTYLTLPKAPYFLKPHPIMLSVLVGLGFSGAVAAKPKESKIANNLASLLNLCALSLLILLMAGQSSIDQLGFESKEKYAKQGPMSIFPALTIALDYMNGMESIAFLGEEIRNPHVNVPRSLFYSLIVCNFYHVSVTLLFAMIVDYNRAEDASYTWIVLLKDLSFDSTSWIPEIGLICALYSCVYTKLFWLSRLAYSMSRDGLFFHMFSKLAHVTGAPVNAAFILGSAAGLCATFFSFGDTTNMEIFSFLVMNVMAPICLLFLRYNDGTGEQEAEGIHRLIFINHPSVKDPTELTEQISSVLIMVIVVSLALMTHIGMAVTTKNENTELARTLLILVVILFIGAFLCLRRQPQHKSKYYMVHLVPALPCLNILLIFIIMEYLWFLVWKFFLVYFSIGIIFYFSYSMHYSREGFLYDPGQWHSLRDDCRLPQPEESIELETFEEVVIPSKTYFWHRLRY